MELVLSAIASGGLVGAANQYACLLIVAIAAKLNWIQLAPQMIFMESIWFIIIVAVFWLITLAPAFGSILSPGVSNFIHTLTNILSGFIVPFSSAILSLAAIGVILDLNPELQKIMETLRFFNQVGNFGATGYFVAAAGALSATALTGLKALSKPAISTTTGTVGTLDTPMFTLIENLASFFLMGTAYLFAKTNPWLLVVLFVITALFVVSFVAYAFSQLKKLRMGIGKVLYLAQIEPRAGLAIVAEFFIWGSGWFAWQAWGRGALMLFFLAFWLISFFLIQPIFVGLFAFIPFLVPIAGFFTIQLLVILFIAVGLFSARSLLKHIEKKIDVSNIQS